ncbi:MAG: hypothetical protein ACFFDO_03560 [Candidatus Thorarchaeota archaeon]
MDNQDFIAQLNRAQDLMSQAKYKEASILLKNLKEIEKNSDFDYNLTHRLYQLYSNCRSLYNQKIILKYIDKISKYSSSVTFHELKNEIHEIDLEEAILGREIELLILRGLLSCRIEKNKIIF